MRTAEEIKSLRKALTMTQAAFAEVMGVDQGTVSNWEKGKTDPTGPALRLMDFLERENAATGSAVGAA